MIKLTRIDKGHYQYKPLNLNIYQTFMGDNARGGPRTIWWEVEHNNRSALFQSLACVREFFEGLTS